MADAGRLDSVRGEGSQNSERTRLGGAAVLVAAVAFVVAGGVSGVGDLPGVGAAVAVVAGWFLLGGVYAFALGQLGAASLLAGSGPLELAAVEIGLLGVLLASAAAPGRYEREPSSPDSTATPGFVPVSFVRVIPSSFVRAIPSTFVRGPALVALAWVLAGGALAWAATESLVQLSVAGVLLIAAAGVAAYALHRYQLVSLGTAGGGGE
jgi:hypothetical protein